jgi:hypothetical protein
LDLLEDDALHSGESANGSGQLEDILPARDGATKEDRVAPNFGPDAAEPVVPMLESIDGFR